jgi:predicted nucleic acid-binding protein
LADHLTVETLNPEETIRQIRAAPDRGTAGGSIYDALHAAAAKKKACAVIHTLNVSHFRHVASEMRIQNLD